MTLEQGKRICSQTAESANERSADHEKRYGARSRVKQTDSNVAWHPINSRLEGEW